MSDYTSYFEAEQQAVQPAIGEFGSVGKPGDYIKPEDLHWDAERQAVLEALENKFALNPNGLYDFVFMAGSTHGFAVSREMIKSALGEDLARAFNPQSDKWNETFIDIEAWMLANASTVFMRLENYRTEDGSLGSMVEVGYTIVNALLRGQKVIISAQSKLHDSFHWSATQLQSLGFSAEVSRVLAREEFAGQIKVHQGDKLPDMQEAGRVIRQTMAEQRYNTDSERLRKIQEDYNAQVEARKVEIAQGKRAPLVVQAGSSGAFSKRVEDAYEEKNAILDKVVYDQDVDYIDLNDGFAARRYNEIYSTSGRMAKAEQARLAQLYNSEFKSKQRADLLAIPIYSDSTSITAVSEIGFRVADAAMSGQRVCVLLEDFDPMRFVREKLWEKLGNDFLDLQFEEQLEAIRKNLLEEGEDLYEEGVNIYDEVVMPILRNEQPIDWGTFRKMHVAKFDIYRWFHKMFRNADNTRRVRGIAKGSLLQLVKNYPGLVYVTNNFADFDSKLQETTKELADLFSGADKAGLYPESLTSFEVAVDGFVSKSRDKRPEAYKQNWGNDFTAEVVLRNYTTGESIEEMRQRNFVLDRKQSEHVTWADSYREISEADRQRISLSYEYKKRGQEVQYRDYTNAPTPRPVNPIGDTGIDGRGVLGKWGPNFAADSVITRTDPATGKLQVLLIRRDEPGKPWALPGGMVDPGEIAIRAAVRETLEETGVDINAALEKYSQSLENGEVKPVYQGMVDDPRNTNNSWMESTVYHIHVDARLADGAKAGDDASDVAWVDVDADNLMGVGASFGNDDSLYSNHEDFIIKALIDMYNDPARRGNLSGKAQRQILELSKKKAPTLMAA